jgi:poly-gamma-glutamate capsule biosynthesis protein CapA/YwtB (metallophosphatase superfamily)
LLDRPRGALGPIARTLRAADLTMVNLESAITERGTPQPKDFRFRTSAAALDVLDAAGVDVVSLANNHAIDYGQVGLRDTLRAKRNSPVAVVGIGRNQRTAFEPHRATVRGTRFAFFAATSRLEPTSTTWPAEPDNPGVATTRPVHRAALLEAVRHASTRGEVVVVYLHWGKELQACPTAGQVENAQALSQAGADIVVGSHAHVLLGSGWLGDTYVNYGLGNFLWYHNHQPDTGVLELRVEDGEVVRDSWTPALIRTYGVPRLLAGRARAAAVEDWRQLPSCAGLAARPPVAP